MIIYKKLLSSSILIGILLFSFNYGLAQNTSAEAIKNGETIYKSNCTACHKLDKRLIGPALFGAYERWKNAGEFNGFSGEKWLIKWVHNSTQVVKDGYPYAVKQFEEFKIPMLPYPQLSDEDILDVFAYINFEENGGEPKALATTSVGDAAENTASASGADAIKGESLFKATCSSCHKIDKKLIGPALKGVRQKWVEFDDHDGLSGQEWLYKWVRNSQGVINHGYPYAVKLYGEYNKSIMTSFGQLSNEDIDNIFEYIETPPVEVVAGTDDASVTSSGNSPYAKTMLYILLGMLVIIALILWRVTGALSKLAYQKQGLPIPIPIPIYRNKKLFVTLGLLVVIYVGYTTVNGAIDLGRQQGYSPTQPIKFSHQLHAGIDKIDCQYCHTGAAKGKQSNIPSLNTCMNCHKGINEQVVNAKHGRREITKIYASIGFNPNTLSYIDDYQNQPREEVEAIFKAWLDDDTERDYTESEVNEVLAQVQQPVEWVRVHNLPDHVYFNHSQHVTVGGLECQTCHGPVEEMEKIYQYAPLSMSWCLSCHRSETVNFHSNDYYKIYDKFHEEIKAGNMSEVTVDNIGGTECQKCHY